MARVDPVLDVLYSFNLSGRLFSLSCFPEAIPTLCNSIARSIGWLVCQSEACMCSPFQASRVLSLSTGVIPKASARGNNEPLNLSFANLL